MNTDLTPMSPAYLAGIIDGEGCLIVRDFNEGRTLLCAIEISNTHWGLIEAIQTSYGGKVYGKTKQPKGTNYKSWNNRFTGPEADRVADAVAPYLIVKKKQMEIWRRARAMMRPRVGIAWRS